MEALQGFAAAHNRAVGNFIAVGDSITDSRMLEAVNRAGGLAIAFNANEYALPYATLGLASTHLSDLADILEAWGGADREMVKQVVREKERTGGVGERGHFHWLEGAEEQKAALEIHRRIRRLVREQAAKLG